MLDLLIKNGLCINPEGSFTGDLAIDEGKIIQIGKGINLPTSTVIDAKGKLVIPGIIDTHVHLPWPSSNFDSVDDFESGSLAAVFGGVTTLIEYVVPDDSGRILPALKSQIAKASKLSLCDFSFHMILRKITEETLKDMAEVVQQGFTSFKIYTAYAGFRLEDPEILKALLTAKELGALVCFHAEDGTLVNFAIEQLAKAGNTHISFYPQAHPRLADIEATQRVIAYAKQLNSRIHIVHVNTQEGADMIGAARREGLPITGETCPHYLTFTEDVYKNGKPEAVYYVLSPVIREERDLNALWNAVVTDDLQTIATDHCPYTSQQKLQKGQDFRFVPGGGAGIETSLPLIYSNGVKTGKISLNRMVELMSTNPAKIFNLFPRKGIIGIGSDADLVIYDPDVPDSKVDHRNLHSKFDHTLYDGMTISGSISATILRGKVIVENGKLVQENPLGQILRRPGY